MPLEVLADVADIVRRIVPGGGARDVAEGAAGSARSSRPRAVGDGPLLAVGWVGVMRLPWWFWVLVGSGVALSKGLVDLLQPSLNLTREWSLLLTMGVSGLLAGLLSVLIRKLGWWR